jgi:hypothetical protein
MSKASERMLHPACAPWWTERLVVVGARLGLWPADTAADGTRLRLSAAGARAAFALPTDAFTRAFVGRGLGGDEPTCYGLTLGARVFRRAGAGEAPFQAVMDEARALREIPTHVTHGFVPWRSDDVLQVADALHAATLAGALTLDHGPFLDRIRRAPEPPSDGRWTVLPNYRVLVPSDTPPQDVFRLACIARLERVDRVAEFLLDRASVSRRSSIEGLDGSAVEILTSRSTHALPETVVQALAEWDRGAPPLRTFIGAVVLTSTPEQAEFLRADASTPAEIAPGVFHVAEYEVRAMLDRARKRGLPIGRVAQASPRGWQHTSDVHETLPDLAAAVRDFSRRFDVVVASEPPKPAPKPAQAAKPGPKATTAQTSKAASAASSATGAASAATLAETIIRTVAIGPRVLRRDFGRFRTALSDDPDLLRRAERLTEDHFDEVEDLQGREAIRSWVREESERWEAAIARIAATAEGAGPADVEDAVARALDVASGGAGSNIDDDEDDDDWLDDEDEDDEAEDDFPSTSEILARLLGTKHAPKGKTSPSPRSSPTSRAGAAAAPSRTPSAAPPPKPPERPWSVHPAGELRRHLADAAEREALVELLYVNAEGRKHERTVRPKSLLTKDGHDWLAVVEPSLGNAQVNLRLDRIAAIRG